MIAYLAERFFAWRIGLLVLLLVTASYFAQWRLPGMGGEAWFRLLLAGLLVLPWRLLDDLADLPSDRQEHPNRVLVRAPSLAPFAIVALLLLLLDLLLLGLLQTFLTALVAGFFFILLMAWYRWGRSWTSSKGLKLHTPLLMTKYPLLVWILAKPELHRDSFPPPWTTTGIRWLVVLAIVYIIMYAYEVLHSPTQDRQSGPTPDNRHMNDE